MEKTRKIIGLSLICVGVLLLIAGILVAFNISLQHTPKFIYASIIVNTVGVIVLRSGNPSSKKVGSGE